MGADATALPESPAGELRASAARLARYLHGRWWEPDHECSEAEAREINRLAILGGVPDVAVALARPLVAAQLEGDDARGALEIARRTLAVTDDVVVRSQLGEALARSGRSNEAIEEYERAVRAIDGGARVAANETGEDRAARRLRADVLGSWGLDSARRGRLIEAEAMVAQDVASDREVGHAGELGRSLLAQAHVLIERGQIEQAERALEEVRSLWTDRRGEREEAALAEMSARVHHRRGRHAEAIALRERALEIVRRLRDRRGEATVLSGLARNLEARGQLDDAAELTERSLEIYRELGDAVGEAGQIRSLGALRLGQGRAQEGEALLWQAVEAGTKAAAVRVTLGSLHVLARIAAERGEHALALRSHERALPLVASMGDPAFHRAVLEAMAEVLDAMGRSDEAAARRGEAAAIGDVRPDGPTSGSSPVHNAPNGP